MYHQPYSLIRCIGPLEVYNDLVSKQTIRDDPYQRTALAILQQLHENIANYDPPIPVPPNTIDHKVYFIHSFVHLFIIYLFI